MGSTGAGLAADKLSGYSKSKELKSFSPSSISMAISLRSVSDRNALFRMSWLITQHSAQAIADAIVSQFFNRPIQSSCDYFCCDEFKNFH